MPVTWDDYLTVPHRAAMFARCRGDCYGAFDRQRRQIARLIAALAPRTVACLGAGLLNDIPLESLVCAGSAIHLIDWVPGSMDAGISLSIIRPGADGGPHCLYCESNVPCPERFCRHFAGRSGAAVCDRFVPRADDPLQCAAFERAQQPSVHYEDVTGGYATAFARLVERDLHDVRSWRQALALARSAAEQAARSATPLSLADASVDLATSSMLISQFEHEPYGYFAAQAASVLGPPSGAEERRLEGDIIALRSTLLLNQVERHCQEVSRILAPGGKWYVSFELFSGDESRDRWFVVTGMPRALEALGRRFTFNFDLLPMDDALSRFEHGGARSLVGGFVLQPKSR